MVAGRARQPELEIDDVAGVHEALLRELHLAW